MKKKDIDHGKSFDWGRTSAGYARYRDIYPEEFYRKILGRGVCVKGQAVLDIGTGTGVLPRNLYQYGAEFTGIDISENQIEQANLLAEKSNMKIAFQCVPAEKSDFPADTFDAVTACQCFAYFDHAQLAPHIHRILKPDGKFVILYMAWLPFDDRIAGESEALILKYNPAWTGRGERRRSIPVPEVYDDYFAIEDREVFDVAVPFTRESWNGRIKACRGIGASLSDEEIEAFENEHRALLEKIAPREFNVLHYAAMTILRNRKTARPEDGDTTP